MYQTWFHCFRFLTVSTRSAKKRPREAEKRGKGRWAACHLDDSRKEAQRHQQNFTEAPADLQSEVELSLAVPLILTDLRQVTKCPLMTSFNYKMGSMTTLY